MLKMHSAFPVKQKKKRKKVKASTEVLVYTDFVLGLPFLARLLSFLISMRRLPSGRT